MLRSTSARLGEALARNAYAAARDEWPAAYVTPAPSTASNARTSDGTDYGMRTDVTTTNSS